MSSLLASSILKYQVERNTTVQLVHVFLTRDFKGYRSPRHLPPCVRIHITLALVPGNAH